MTGQAKIMIDKLISEKSRGDRFIENGIRVKLILKGIDVDSFTETSQDEDADIVRVRAAAMEYGVSV